MKIDEAIVKDITANNNSGYVIYIVLLILSISSILFFIILNQISASNKFALHTIHLLKARKLAESGVARAEYFLNGGDGHSMSWETDSLKEDINTYGTILIRNKNFGLFSKLVSVGKFLNESYTISGLVGRDIPKNLMPSLTITGHVGGLVLQDGSSVDGFIVLHHGEVYKNKYGSPMVEYRKQLIIRESPSLPFDSLLIPKLFERMENERISLPDGKNRFNGNLNIDNSNDSAIKADIIIVNGNCSILSGEIKQKKIIIAGNLNISGRAKIDESQIVAEKNFIDGGITDGSLFYSSKQMRIFGGNHNSQFFSLDSIKVRKEARFGTMNLIAGMRKASGDTLVKGAILFEEGSEICGTVISCFEPGKVNSNCGIPIVFGSNCRINGIVISDYDIDIKEAKIRGHIWARSIVTRNEKQSFTDYLINITLEKPEIESTFPLTGVLPARIVFER
jgi:hypothetical protein